MSLDEYRSREKIKVKIILKEILLKNCVSNIISKYILI